MSNYYFRFIKPPEIQRDLNFFYKKIHDGLIIKKFTNYLLNVRKKSTEREFTTHGYLSSFSETRLKFSGDTITINFSIDESKGNSLQDKSNVIFSKFNYKQDTICDLHILIDIKISKVEFKQKMIYKENRALIQLRKELNVINNYSLNRKQKSMEKIFPKLNKDFQNIKHNSYWEWNDLLRLLKDCTDPTFNENLNKIKIIVNAIDTDFISTRHMIIKKTDFYNRYSTRKQIKPQKLIKSLKEHCLDENELIYLSNLIAKCLGTNVKTLEETEEFLFNVVNHFNMICFSKNSQIAKTIFVI